MKTQEQLLEELPIQFKLLAEGYLLVEEQEFQYTDLRQLITRKLVLEKTDEGCVIWNYVANGYYESALNLMKTNK